MNQELTVQADQDAVRSAHEYDSFVSARQIVEHQDRVVEVRGPLSAVSTDHPRASTPQVLDYNPSAVPKVFNAF